MTAAPLEFRRLEPSGRDALADFFRRLRSAPAVCWFHPYPLMDAQAAALSAHRGRDLYWVLTDAGRVLGYGMLRGWDQGFEVPSLGIAVAPEERGRGLGRLMTDLLHEAARRRGAGRVRITVYTRNEPALRLFRAAGYRFRPLDADRLEGFRPLEGAR